MNVLVFLFSAIILFYLAYRFYARYISGILGVTDKRPTPAIEQHDGRDFVATRPPVLFAHHFSTIAGAGPIVGPTLGILYGVGPAWFWVVLGAILFGGVHDFVALFASIRERGCSMAEIARKALGPTGFLLFIMFTIIMIILVTSAFLSLTSISLTSLWPLDRLQLPADQTLLRTRVVDGQVNGVIGGIASMSVVIITLISPLFGFFLIRKGIKVWLSYLIAFALAVLSIWIGFHFPITFSPVVWMVIISIYTMFACQAPVWLIIQPRDFVNVQILYAGMIAMFIGVLVGGFQGVTLSYPMTNYAVGAAKMGPVWPFLFITIACGAISGFHSLVSGGTSSKQIARESQARPISYGSMLLEGLLAVLVILTIGSSLSYNDYLRVVWPDVGAGNPILAFALSMGHLLNTVTGFSVAFGTVIGVLVVEGFVITTLDTAVRLNRYLFEELWKSIFAKPPFIFRQYWFNSGLCVVLMFLLAYSNGYKLIWPLFGSSNQLLAALSLIAVTVWLHRAGKPSWFTLLPAIVMIVTTIGALIYALVVDYLPAGNIALATTDIILLVLSLGVVALSLKQLAAFRPRPTPAIQP
ncbi:carbon starvation protein A [candidate division GN15 bacterium]|uniref:Carbon starvation protein A n=1 Tax=candidate division GN15 bacterium TaxID=2072418 RepID=A0A855WZH6_9BACT|nr:MAG: carbon starvation protein A [candidate division GN15 bacterium]